MKIAAVVLLVATLAAGLMFNTMKKEDMADKAMNQDTVESSLAAPARPEIPL